MEKHSSNADCAPLIAAEETLLIVPLERPKINEIRNKTTVTKAIVISFTSLHYMHRNCVEIWEILDKILQFD